MISGSMIELKKYFRFKEVRQTDYFYMYKNWPDAIKVIPKKPTCVMGFGYTNSYHKKDFFFEFQWKLDDGQQSDKVKIEVTQD